MNQEVQTIIKFTFDVDTSLDKNDLVNCFIQHCKNFGKITNYQILSNKEESEIYETEN